ncbi:hypothetical protein KM92DES2_12598 [uncultured Desulfovibrio sp.]|uniref:Uncharacterized protein n=1 Tax=uncultured Desulfovibrio sp. TaxID=167968 RepID=A0A212KBF1_9BACT|nr:hypothetical protein KM92DES2_12598 [uncultured Desulfovibrio sp.]
MTSRLVCIIEGWGCGGSLSYAGTCELVMRFLSDIYVNKREWQFTLSLKTAFIFRLLRYCT